MESEPDNQTIVLVAKTAAEETAKLYGSIFTRMVSKYALQFEAEKLKEKPQENIQGLEAVTNYILANLKRYPRGYCALIYGMAKADIKFWGSTGAGSRRAAYSAMKSIFEGSGLLKSIIGTTKDPFEALYTTEKINKEIKTASPARYIREENNQVIVVVPNCIYMDACSAFVKEGISRLIGGSECIFLIVTNVAAEIITEKHLDYRLDEFNESECRGRIFEF
nr:hypothetical protein [Candidatus Freyarchaeota archaeon]